MEKLNDYQKFYAIKRAFKNNDYNEMFYNGKIIASVWLDSIMVFAGVSRLKIQLTGEKEAIYADIQDIIIK